MSDEANLAKKYEFLHTFAKEKFDLEEKREEAIIQQASQMQTVFSFMTAALFMVLPVVLEHSAGLSMRFIFIAFSSITLALLFSLFFAMMAQNRKYKAALPDVKTMADYITENESYFETEEQRHKYMVDTYAEVQESKCKLNGKRINWIKRSMTAFYCSLGLCAFWFVVAICKIL